MKRFASYSAMLLIVLLLIPGSVWAGKRVAKARISDGPIKGSAVMATIPSGWRIMAYVRGLTIAEDAAICIEHADNAGDGSCVVPVCGVNDVCEVDDEGNLSVLIYLSGGDFMSWPTGGGQNFVNDLDDGNVNAVLYHDDGDGVSSAAFVVVFP